jgi:hypothetical protein
LLAKRMFKLPLGPLLSTVFHFHRDFAMRRV